MAISPVSFDVIQKIIETNSTKSISSGVEEVGKSFQEILSGLNQSQLNADDLVNKLAMGEDVDLHEVMIGLEENDINFKVAISLRDKLVDAYQEVMRMQV